ncbi:hypothetical protein K2173_015524 [Erythroxylum novogranatense]|uniref:DUF4283 domain-containing protein n=1 Tax=Erythroxylum novogranatense TaxID=1862640 RepID=A0AAV8SRX5_9ROSI|nr:hypothetical protein K2173_015524 [Erythroxylum novogranatense]
MDDEMVNEIVFGEEEIQGESQSYQLCLVGRFLTEKGINFMALKQTLASLWRPSLGTSVQQIEDENLYMFCFYHVVDMDRVMNMSPWTFNGQVLLLEKIGEHKHPSLVPLFHVYMWLQVHNLRDGYWFERVAERIGNEVGEYVEVDSASFRNQVKTFMRLRVKFDVRKPLSNGMYLRRKGDQGFFANFQFEKLPNFCFLCGLMDHGERFCPKLIESNGTPVERKFGPELRADPRRKVQNIRVRWLRDTPPTAEEIATVMRRSTNLGNPNVSPESQEDISSSNHNLNGRKGGDFSGDKGIPIAEGESSDMANGTNNGKAQ